MTHRTTTTTSFAHRKFFLELFSFTFDIFYRKFDPFLTTTTITTHQIEQLLKKKKGKRTRKEKSNKLKSFLFSLNDEPS
jgi:hypothetical protein